MRWLWLLLLATSAWAQGGNTVILNFPGAPSGSCASVMLANNSSTGDFYNCLTSSWNKVNGAGGGGTINAGLINQTAFYAAAGTTLSGTPSLLLSAVSPITPIQTANNLDVFYSKRFTDTVPTGSFLHFQNAAGNADLYKLDILGNESALSLTTGNGAGVAGATAWTQGTAAATQPANSFYITSPTSIPTRYGWIMPTAGATGIVHYTTGDPGAIAFSAVSLTADVSGILPVANGGTGLASGTSGGILGYTASGTLASSVALTANVLVKGGGAAATPLNSSVTDNGTTVSTSEDYVTTGRVQTGSSPPNCTAGTAGTICATEGTAPTNVASTDAIYADSTAHEWLSFTAGATTNPGMIVRRQPSPINQTGQTALIGTSTLCAASAGACNVAGQYHIHINVWGSGTACGTPAPGGVTPSLTWTDENAVSHAAVVVPMMAQTTATGTLVNVTAPTVPFESALANEGGSGDFTISTNGTVIQYAVAYAACGVGTGTYNIRIAVTRLQ